MNLQERIADWKLGHRRTPDTAGLVDDLIANLESKAVSLEAALESRAGMERQLAQQAADSSADDTAIRELCGHVDDGYMMPIVDVVRKAMASVAEVTAYCQRRLHSGVNAGSQQTCGEVLKILEGK